MNTRKVKKIYQRPKSLIDVPMHYCPGCGHAMTHKILAQVIDSLNIREKTIGVAPVGCAVLAYDYINCDISEAAHGRVPAVATGIKRSLPDRIVFGYQGDGDLAAIGLTETIHTANRGENITIIFINNAVYGMTGGQMAPTTLLRQKTATSPEGRLSSIMGNPLRMCEMINTLDKPYYIERVALDGPKGILKAKKALEKAFKAQIAEKGYTFVELLSPCPTYIGHSPIKAIEYVKTQMARVFPTRVFRNEGVPINA